MLVHAILQVEAGEADAEPAIAAAAAGTDPLVPAKPAAQPGVKIPSLGCSKCRWSAKGCKKCRADHEAALQVRLACRRSSASVVYNLCVLHLKTVSSCELLHDQVATSISLQDLSVVSLA